MTYTYGGNGQPSSIASPGGVSLTYGYNGLLPTSTTFAGPVSGAVGRTYDTDFRIASETVNGGSPIACTFNADSLPTAVGSLTLTYNAQHGFLTGTTLGGVSDAPSFDGFGQLGSCTASYSGAPVYAQQYTRDGFGRVTDRSETIGGVTDDYEYTYDLAGRLVESRKNSAIVAGYTYDSNGNRLTRTDAGGTVTSVYDAQDRLLQLGTTTYTYSAHGELASKTAAAQVTTYQYDELGNLRAVGLPGRHCDRVRDRRHEPAHRPEGERDRHPPGRAGTRLGPGLRYRDDPRGQATP